MVENYILVNDGEHTITGDDIITLTVTRSNSLMLEEMSSDSCEATVINSSGILDDLAYGTKMQIVRDIAVQDTFYLSKVTRLNRDQYKLEMTSFFGILDNEIFYGGYYTGETFQSVVESIIQTNGLDTTTTDHADVLAQIEYDDGIEDLPVYGWIKVVSKREALHQVLFSRGVSMKRTSTGAIRFSLIYDTDPTIISEDRIYENSDLNYLPSVSDLEVEEHTYTDDARIDKPNVLFENREATSVGKTYVAVFNCDSPVLRPIQAHGLNVIYQNCNAAEVTGIGYINGFPSVHSTTIIKEQISETKGDTVSIKDCTMITLANSAYVMDRLRSYYLTAKTKLTTGIVRLDERTGMPVSVVNAFGERVSGFITKMQETYSGIVKADCEIITDYHPVVPEIEYSHSVVLSGSGGWVVPESVFLKDEPKIKVILIGGGTGGYSGLAGENGVKGYPDGESTVSSGKPGDGGNGGQGGKIYEFEIANPSQTLYYSCGTGGNGGSATSSTTTQNAGTDGTDSQITDSGTTYSSSSGERISGGVINPLTGMQYGQSHYNSRFGNNWKFHAAGAYGGIWNSEGTYTTAYDFDFTTSPPTYELVEYDGGSVGRTAYAKWHYTGAQSPYYVSFPQGGCGGGAAAGSNGGNGGNASGGTAGYMSVAGVGGKGGSGANATLVPPKPNDMKRAGFLPWDDGGFGDGGLGGYGGGGGGQGGEASDFSYQGFRGFYGGDGGSGGKGGVGGSGGDGCVLIYY